MYRPGREPSHRLAAHAIVEQQQRIRASRQPRLRLPIPHQRDQVRSDVRIKKAAANHAPDKNRSPRQRQAIFRLPAESIEFTNGLDRLLQLLIIGERAANLGDALAPYAELPRASTGVGYCQNEDVMAVAPRAFWAALGVPDGPLQQRAAQQLTGDRQFADAAFRVCEQPDLELDRQNQRRQSVSISNPYDHAQFSANVPIPNSGAPKVYS